MEPCCENLANRLHEEESASHRVERCLICQRRHHLFWVDPIPVGVTLEAEA